MKTFTRDVSACATAVALALGAAGAAHADPLAAPAMGASLSANPNPASFDAGPLGKVSVSGVLTGLGIAQNHALPGDYKSRGDLSNGQVIVQTTEGPLQFYVQGGAYSFATVGVPYFKASDTVPATYGVVPVAYAKIVPNDKFNIQIGKMATIIGSEYPFTFQNLNIQRGMLWNQENVVVRAAQANYVSGPISASVQISDGFYSNKYSWLSGLVAFTIDPSNVLAFGAGANLSSSGGTGTATPLLQNNSEIYNVYYTHTSGPLMIAPYFQYTRVPEDTRLGITKASTISGAVLVNYKVNDNFRMAARAEYINSKGGSNLLYGTGSDAWSLTVTPTYQMGVFFVRGEVSYVKASDVTPGSAFGSAGLNTSQTRGLIETGFLF